MVVTAAFALGRAVSADPQVSLFAAFGGFALLTFVDLPGRWTTRLRSYAVLVAVGVVCITVATLCSTHPVAAVVATAVAGFTILFLGVVSVQVTASTMGALLVFVLPVSLPADPGEVPARLAGWLIASALAVPAALLVWPTPYRDELRRQEAIAARALAALVADHAAGRPEGADRADAVEELAELRRRFESAPQRPSGASAEETAAVKLVGRLEWVGSHALSGRGRAAALGLPEVVRLEASVAEVLAASADVLDGIGGRPAAGDGSARRLERAVTELASQRRAVFDLAAARVARQAAAGDDGATDGPRWGEPTAR